MNSIIPQPRVVSQDSDPDMDEALRRVRQQPIPQPASTFPAPCGYTCCGQPMAWRNGRYECDECYGAYDPGVAAAVLLLVLDVELETLVAAGSEGLVRGRAA